MTGSVANLFMFLQHLKRFVNDRKVEGFCKVIASSNITEGLSYV